ncbi:MAG: L,D-transpeptidase family protein [Candidatus Omnitrophota bacterium]
MNKKLALIIAAVIIAAAIFIIIGVKTGSRASLNKGRPLSMTSLLNKAKELEGRGDLLGTRNAYQELASSFPNAPEADSWEKKAEELNIKLLFSSIVTPKSILYKIKTGDTLNKIAREHQTTVELLMKSNNLTGDRIIPGRELKVWIAPFSIVVDKSQNILILKSDEDVIKTYNVATGLNNCTPVGTFRIVNKLKDPTWFKAGAVVPADSSENILGSRWMGFNLAGYGIHGTTEPETIGKQATQGCIRMVNSDVEELYAIVPEGTEVTIVD